MERRGPDCSRTQSGEPAVPGNWTITCETRLFVPVGAEARGPGVVGGLRPPLESLIGDDWTRRPDDGCVVRELVLSWDVPEKRRDVDVELAAAARGAPGEVDVVRQVLVAAGPRHVDPFRVEVD